MKKFTNMCTLLLVGAVSVHAPAPDDVVAVQVERQAPSSASAAAAAASAESIAPMIASAKNHVIFKHTAHFDFRAHRRQVVVALINHTMELTAAEHLMIHGAQRSCVNVRLDLAQLFNEAKGKEFASKLALYYFINTGQSHRPDYSLVQRGIFGDSSSNHIRYLSELNIFPDPLMDGAKGVSLSKQDEYMEDLISCLTRSYREHLHFWGNPTVVGFSKRDVSLNFKYFEDLPIGGVNTVARSSAMVYLNLYKTFYSKFLMPYEALQHAEIRFADGDCSAIMPFTGMQQLLLKDSGFFVIDSHADGGDAALKLTTQLNVIVSSMSKVQYNHVVIYWPDLLHALITKGYENASDNLVGDAQILAQSEQLFAKKLEDGDISGDAIHRFFKEIARVCYGKKVKVTILSNSNVRSALRVDVAIDVENDGAKMVHFKLFGLPMGSSIHKGTNTKKLYRTTPYANGSLVCSSACEIAGVMLRLTQTDVEIVNENNVGFLWPKRIWQQGR